MKMFRNAAIAAVTCAVLGFAAHASACPKDGSPKPKDPKPETAAGTTVSLDTIACPKNGTPKPGEPKPSEA